MRKIIHIDMDAFFASIEQRDFPHLRGKPVVVGGSPQSRSVVATASYEARAFGIHSAMSCAKAYRLCPQAIFLPPRFEVYQAVSAQIRAIFHEITPLVEPLSLDEAYLDVSKITLFQGSATHMAQFIRQEIMQRTQLSASAGVSYNKMFAKLASDMQKPNGLTVITPEQGEAFIAQLPVEKIHGIGKATAKKLHDLGVYTGSDLKDFDLGVLRQHLGKLADFYHQLACGVDRREVCPNRARQSFASEETFAHDLQNPKEIFHQIIYQNKEAFARLLKNDAHLRARTVAIKIKFSDFTSISRQFSASEPFYHPHETHPHLQQLFTQIFNNWQGKAVRLVGVSLSNFCDIRNRLRQLSLFV